MQVLYIYLKEELTKFKVLWRIFNQAAPYNLATNRCNLHLGEKYFTIWKPDSASLNKQKKFISSCRHASKYPLTKSKPSLHTEHGLSNGKHLFSFDHQSEILLGRVNIWFGNHPSVPCAVCLWS